MDHFRHSVLLPRSVCPNDSNAGVITAMFTDNVTQQLTVANIHCIFVTFVNPTHPGTCLVDYNVKQRFWLNFWVIWMGQCGACVAWWYILHFMSPFYRIESQTFLTLWCVSTCGMVWIVLFVYVPMSEQFCVFFDGVLFGDGRQLRSDTKARCIYVSKHRISTLHT